MNDAMEDYKNQIESGMKATLTWQRDLLFTATTQRGYDLDFDASSQWGCMPLESLVMSLAGCMAIDVVSILGKMRASPTSFGMEISADRSETPPQRIRGIKMHLRLEGDDLTDDKVARAVSLSEEKYCSVMHSLREDIEVKTEFTINGAG